MASSLVDEGDTDGSSFSGQLSGRRVKPWLFAFPTGLFFQLSDKIIPRSKSSWSLQGFPLSLVITPVESLPVSHRENFVRVCMG